MATLLQECTCRGSIGTTARTIIKANKETFVDAIVFEAIALRIIKYAQGSSGSVGDVVYCYPRGGSSGCDD